MRYALSAWVARWVLVIALAIALWWLGIEVGFGGGALLVEAALLVTLIPLWRRGELGARDLGLRAVPGARATGLAVLALLACTAFSYYWMRALHLPEPVRSGDEGLSHAPTLAIVLAGVAACVGAPVVEEIFFRGFLYRSLRNRFTVVGAALVSSMLFGFDHTQYPLSVRPVVMFFGVVMCLLYERTGSLLPGIAVHSLIDGSAFERALSGGAPVVAGLYMLLALVLLVRPPLRGFARMVTGRPVFRDYSLARDGERKTRALPASRANDFGVGDWVGLRPQSATPSGRPPGE